MNDPVSAREALMIEAIGEAAELLESVGAMTAALQGVGQEIARADAGLRENLAAFEGRMTAVMDNGKTRAVEHVVARINEANARSIETQSSAMAEAARVAFANELGPTLKQLQSALKTLVEQRQRYWESWFTHLAVAVTASTATWFLALRLLGG